MNEYSIINSNNKKIIFYYFYDIDTSCIAAIEYVIKKYGDQIWFNAALKKVITDIYSKQRKDICSIPFIIIKRNYKTKDKNKLTYKGYHYIIYKIKQYYNKYNNNNNNILISSYIVLILMIIIIIIMTILTPVVSH